MAADAEYGLFPMIIPMNGHIHGHHQTCFREEDSLNGRGCRCSCADSTMFDDDPWANALWSSSATGLVDTEIVVSMVQNGSVTGKIVIVHDASGTRVGCGRLILSSGGNNVANITLMPGYTGPASAIAGSVTFVHIHRQHLHGTFGLIGRRTDKHLGGTFTLSGLPDSVTGSFTVHDGTSCTDIGSVLVVQAVHRGSTYRAPQLDNNGTESQTADGDTPAAPAAPAVPLAGNVAMPANCPACCSGFEAAWTTSKTSGHETVKTSGSSVLMKFADDTECGGTVNSAQAMTATATIVLAQDSTFDLLWSGVGEAKYERMTISVNGRKMTHFAAMPDGTCDVNSCTMCNTLEQTVTMHMKAGTNTISVTATSQDGLFHKDAFFSVRFRQGSCDEDCSVCDSLLNSEGQAYYYQ
jgi:hypothetical protein